MGSGKWSTDVYTEHNRYKADAGKSTFDYSDSMHRSSRSDWRAHPSLNPYGVTMRESHDSEEHPTSTAVVILFDVTGSMGEVPVTLQKKLPELLGLLLRKDYITDPQILFGAIGDATCDSVPFQIGQFESDNRMDENLENIFLEGGGGGQQTESYELGMYFIARHTDIDCWNKRGHKGYLFLIGDEEAYSQVNKRETELWFGDSLEQNIPTPEIVKELKKRYHVFYLLPKAASYGGDPVILKFWRGPLGQNVLQLEDAEAVCETIALAIGMTEGTVDLAGGIDDLKEFSVAASTLRTVSHALAALPAQVRAKPAEGALNGLDRKALPTGKARRL